MTSSSSDPFAWLGLLKWSLAYSDGTSQSSTTPMSKEDKEFLEKVMKEGIIDENERMKVILQQFIQQIEIWKENSSTTIPTTNQSTKIVETTETTTTIHDEKDNDNDNNSIYDALQELRDIVEQIDYARAFTAMKGLPFLLGCIQEIHIIPKPIRVLCLGIIATVCQHNPPVQKELLELGSLRIFCTLLDDISNHIYNNNNNNNGNIYDNDENGEIRARIIQAMSANVRSYDLAEDVFCQLQQAPDIVLSGLIGDTNKQDGMTQSPPPPPLIVRKRTLFLLRAILTSDTTTSQRIQRFQSCIVQVMDTIISYMSNNNNNEHQNTNHNNNTTSHNIYVDQELVEMGLSMIQQILEQRVYVNGILQQKQSFAATAVRRIAYLRSIQDIHDQEYYSMEMEYWERILSLLADAKPNSDTPPINE